MENDLTKVNKAELRAKCSRFLSGHLPLTQRAWLEKIAASPVADTIIDRYGEGPAMQALEQEVAKILGKEAGIFMHKGVTAQQCALRVWTDRKGIRNVALHPKCHIDVDERNAYERLQNLCGVRVGKDYKPFTLADLEAVHEPLGAITVELPLVGAGYKLPKWEELVAISEWAHQQQIPLHIDGARLWESGPYYNRSYAELAALADSVYVSFYKGLGGMAGCVLAGTKDFIDEVRVWQTRLGGSIFTVFPFIIAATEGLHHHLPKMEAYVHRARQLAAILTSINEVTIVPDPPHTNAFQIYLKGNPNDLTRVSYSLAETEGIWLFNYFDETIFPGLVRSEITVGEATEQWEDSEIANGIEKLLSLSKSYS